MRKAKEKPWYEQDYFWQTFAPVLFTNKLISSANEEVEQLISLLDLQPGLRICDMCCGIGRHSLELARRQFEVVSVDRTSIYLQKAKAKAKVDRLNIEFVQEDIRSFRRPVSFDVVVNLFTSFGYFENPADDKLVLENIYESLKDNGKLLMDLMGKEVLARIFQERDWREENDFIILKERKVSENWGLQDSHWIMLKDGKRYECRISLRLYSATELCELLKNCGFRQVDVYGGLDGSPYDQEANRLIAVANK